MTCEEEIRALIERLTAEKPLLEKAVTTFVLALAKRIDGMQIKTIAIDQNLSGIACELYDAKVELGLFDPDD